MDGLATVRVFDHGHIGASIDNVQWFGVQWFGGHKGYGIASFVEVMAAC